MCYIILHYIILYRIVLCCIVLYYVMLRYIVLYYIMLCYVQGLFLLAVPLLRGIYPLAFGYTRLGGGSRGQKQRNLNHWNPYEYGSSYGTHGNYDNGFLYYSCLTKDFFTILV